jgi:multiple sugar transport system substrate-binding protein
MVHLSKGAVALMAALLLSTAASAQSRVLTFTTDNNDPAPKAAWEQLVADFEAENPDVDVQMNIMDREAYKTAIRNFLTTDPPDVANWYPANRMAPFVSAGLFMDISDVYAANDLGTQLASTLPIVTQDGKQWMVPYTYYQWGMYFNRTVYDQVGATIPATWEEFLANCEKFKAAEIDCLTTGSSQLWPIAGIFDYINLRTNGYEFHKALTNGEIAWTDDRVRATFAEWAKVLPFTTANHAAIDWQDAVPLIVQGKAANYVMGNFAVAAFKEGGMTNDTLGFLPFPTINPDVPRAEEAPTDAVFIPAGAKNVDDAKAFMAFVARADVQTKLNTALGQLPVNAGSTVGDDPFLQAGFEMLSTTPGGIAQFFDRDAPAEMAKAGMEGFQEFMVRPENLDAILDRLEKARARIYQ